MRSPAVLLLLALAAPMAAQDLALTPITVINVADGSFLSDQTVLVRGNRIVAVGPVADVVVPEEAEIVDGAGGYLIPGLWDMHVHTFNNRVWAEAFFPLFLANGVTGVRDMWKARELAERGLAAVRAGELSGPVRAVVAGNLVDGPARIWPGSQVALTPEDGRRIVDSLHAVGAPFVKVYSSLSPETYFAIAERAQALGLPFAGHVPAAVRASDASDAGQRSIEHFLNVLEGCAAEEENILAAFGRTMAAARRGDTAHTVSETFEERYRHALATQDDARCRTLADRFVENETWQVPTLVATRGYIYWHELAAAGDERLGYLPSSIYENSWAPWIPDPDASPSPNEPVLHTQAKWERDMEIIGMMAAAGVPFLAGTDTPNPWAFPGFGLHDELELLVAAGLTPLQALQAATLNPARFFGRTDELGTVEKDKLADLVLLDANPLDDITNTQRIRAVVADGRLYRRADLDRILAEAAAQNDRVSIAALVGEMLEAEGIEAARERHRALHTAAPDSVLFDEEALNGLGYRLLQAGRLDEAVAVFEMNTEAYPASPNPYDSLGDGLRAAGRLEEARDAYARAVALAEARNDPRVSGFRANLESVSQEISQQR